MARQRILVKLAVGTAILALLAVLFLRSVSSTRAEPFAVGRATLTGWTLESQPGADPLGSWLALRPPDQLAAALGRDIFRRGGESVNYPNPAVVPLLLQSEYDRAFAGRVPPEQIVSLARAAGLESTTWTPRCMGYRRVSEPGTTRGVYFLLLDAAPFDDFRQRLLALRQSAGGDQPLFDPPALSPVLIVAALDGNFGRWMPLRAEPESDCMAQIEVT
jgi:hypothetical protein